MKNLKRIHLFELEDQSWFPNIIRDCMTKTINVMHSLVKTNKHLPALLARILKETNTNNIIDLCSGGGGPMVEAIDILKRDYGLEHIKLKLTDLYPHKEFANHINSNSDGSITYSTQPLDATNFSNSEKGLSTMICSFHHMRPEMAKQILRNAQTSKQPILIFEISDNSHPNWLTLMSMPITFILCLFVTLKVRPMTWQQIVFTYLIPIIPISFAWDGAVSNVRTYTLSDLKVLLNDLQSDNYHWETGAIESKPSSQLYIIGKPI